ncbi:MAG TPA: SIS domain-containing protein [Thermoleophilaceae bacterium]
MSGQTRLEDELRDQGAVLARRAQAGAEAAERAAALLRRDDVRYLVVAARGSSDNAARFGQYLLGSAVRLNVALAAPSLYSDPARAPDLSGAAAMAISQSGQSPDIVSVLTAARAQGRPTIAITNDENSPLALAAHAVVPLATGPEESLSATKTYVASLHSLVQLAQALAPDDERASGLAALPALLTSAVEEQLASRSRFDVLRDATRLTAVGRGVSFATAYETALKIRELAGITAEAFSPPDLLHGPIAALTSGNWVWLAAGHDRQGQGAELLSKLRQRSVPAVVVAQSTALLAAADVAIPLRGDVPDWLAAILAVVPGQVAGFHLAELRGVEIDHPHGLSKVTLTH